MFRPNALKQCLRAGKRALGCWTVLGSPAVIELLAYTPEQFAQSMLRQREAYEKLVKVSGSKAD
jgi:hypothetical protein